MTADDNAAVKSPALGIGVSPPLSELKKIGKYLIEKKIGAGGMGTVFLARDAELKRTVAIKVLPQDKAQNPTLVRRFRAEAQAAAQLRHPNIVAVYDSGEADGYLYIAMEYVDGRDLFEMVSRRGVIPVRRSIDIVKQVASALQHAYEQNIVHRDIKPSNLLIRRDGVVKLTDLGLARSIDDTLETNITRAGTTVGTVDYMAPEQARNSKLADIRSDLYSLGCTWYQMLTGSAPYPEGSVTNKLQAHAIKPVPDPRDKNPQVPEGLTAVLRRMMAKKPEDRYQTPAELIEELDHAKLTDAAISRQIFSDMDDGEEPPLSSDDEEESADDSYFEMESRRTEQATPDQAPAPVNAPASRKSKSQSTRHDAVESEPAAGRTRPRPKSDRSEPEPEVAATSGRLFKPIAPVAPAEEEERDPSTRRSKARTDKSAESEPVGDSQRNPKFAGSKQAETKPLAEAKHADAKQADSKQADAKGARPKVPGQKTLPPKRQPLPVAEGAGESALNPDLFRRIALGGGVVFVIVGIGWLISGYNANFQSDNPFAPSQPAPPSTVISPMTGGPVKPPETQVETIGSTENNNPGVNKPDAVIPFDVEKVPEWATRDADTTGLQMLTVSAAPRSETNFEKLEEALKAVPPGGAVIKLQGAGPFTLPMVELEQRQRIVISSASPQDRPVIVLKPAEGENTAGLKLKEGSLDLRGLHFTFDRQTVSGPCRIVEVDDGQLFVRRCSFTAHGTGTEPAIAMVVQSTVDATSVPRLEPNLLVDQVVVRGDGLGGLSIRRGNVDAVIRESLLATGSAPDIEVAGHIAAGVAEVSTTKPRRIIRVLRSTLSSQKRIFDVSVDEGGKPPQTAIVLRDSICAAQGIVPASAIVFGGRWPQIRSTSESWLTKMTWSSTNTLYLGFEQLVDLGSSFKVMDVATWQRVWNIRADSRQFQKFAFPETTIEDLGTALPQEFDSGRISYRDVKATDGGLPGFPVGKVSTPDTVSQQRASVMTSRPTIPMAVQKPGEPAQVRKVDMKKDDLGLILNRTDWPSGTLFEASGGGLCMMTPAKVDGRSFRIVFRQTEGTSLKIQPVQPKNYDAAKSNGPPALIWVTRGSMELVNATLEGYPNPRGFTPDWLIQSSDSTVVLTGCRLMGSEADGSRQQGLVRWITDPEVKSGEPPALVIRESYLAGTGSGVRAECGSGSLILRNSVIAIRGDALDLRPVRSGKALLGVLDAENVTMSATNAAVRFEAAQGAEAITEPFRILTDRCVIVPPLAFKAGEAANSTVLQLVGPVMEQKQLHWWGNSNGVARQVVHMVRRDGDTGAPSDEKTGLTAWKKLWDKGSIIRLLTGDKGVYLSGELPVRWKELKPTSFELHKNSQAATWAEGGRPIGANTQVVEDSSIAKKGPDPAKPNQPGPIVPSKKNVGF